MPTQTLSLWSRRQPVYVAVCKHGYGVSTKPAMAIWRALREVPLRSKRSQMLLYEASEVTEPKGFKDGVPVWPNSIKPRLVGLTNTHTAWKQRPRIE